MIRVPPVPLILIEKYLAGQPRASSDSIRPSEVGKTNLQNHQTKQLFFMNAKLTITKMLAIF
jgi:hypothetical protein